MKLNSFLFQNFTESKRGGSLIKFFSNYENYLVISTQYHILDFIVEELSHDGEEKERTEELLWRCNSLMKNPIYTNTVNKTDVSSFSEFEELYQRLIDVLKLESDLWNISTLSHCLYMKYPNFCFPYFFGGAHYRLRSFFEVFGIYSPPIPKKKDTYARAFHYIELCKALYDFRKIHKMNEYELPAFLYGFAPNIVEKYRIDDVLPEPRSIRIHIVTAENDMMSLDNAKETSIQQWSGSEETEPGDIIIKYCAKPRSCLHSIWRAITPGFLDPFFYYYKSVYIAYPIHIAPISFKQMKEDDVIGQSSFIKMGMQGANGKPIKKIYYDKILAMLNEQGMSLEGIPILHEEPEPSLPIKTERDVEKNLLEPLLERLGYTENDWKRQMKLRMGRGDRVYPDYVIFPIEERNNESGYQAWEAKFSIKSNKQLLEDFGQVKSYATRLNCKLLGLVSKEGIWFSDSKTGFDVNKLRFWSWTQVSSVDHFNELYALAGRKKRFV